MSGKIIPEICTSWYSHKLTNWNNLKQVYEFVWKMFMIVFEGGGDQSMFSAVKVSKLTYVHILRSVITLE